tara:strand:+ start:372 stop:686 length:315 start_codon:yes stop_codon:yes gene_type:complete
MKNISILVLVVLTTFFLNSCQSVKDGLSGTKKKNSDEFLVKKKNPLVLPPDFEKLPTPSDTNVIEENDEFDLKKVLNKRSQDQVLTNKSDTKLEKSIIEKIKGN